MPIFADPLALVTGGLITLADEGIGGSEFIYVLGDVSVAETVVQVAAIETVLGINEQVAIECVNLVVVIEEVEFLNTVVVIEEVEEP